MEIGLKGVAITDHECLSAHIEAIQHYKKMAEKHPQFKLILGNEIYLINEGDYQNTSQFFHFLLLAKDLEGHRQLRELSTRAWKRMYSYKRLDRVPTFYSDLQEVIGRDRGHIIGMTACLGGYFPKLLLNKRHGEAKVFADWCTKLFGDGNFYIELQPGTVQEQMDFNTEAIQFCKRWGLPWVFTNDVHYLTKEKRKLHAAYLNSKNEERETNDFYENTYFKTEEEIYERTAYLDKQDVAEGLNRTVKIADAVQSYDLAQNVIIPERKLPEFHLLNLFRPYYDRCGYIRLYSESPYEQDRYILYQIEKGFQEKGEKFSEENLSRIDVELKQLWKISAKLKQRMSCYYNLVQLIIQIMWDDRKGNSLVGPARGSVTGYYICFLMDITQVNPLKWNLPYWRHLVAERPELPDVDIDSQSSQRPVIFKAMKEEFGWEHSLNIITFKRETSKAAVLTACRGLGIDIDAAKELAGLVPITRGKVWSIRECLEGNEDNGHMPIKEFVNKVKQYEMLLETILEIEDLICGRSSHASGFYLFNNHFLEQNSLMKTPKGIEVTCWDMGDSDYCGALKVDFLTVEALDKIRKTMNLLTADKKMEWQGTLKSTYDKYLHPKVLDYTEPGMWEMLGEGKIVDVFQFDTLVGSEAVKKIKPTGLKQLAIANSIMRLMGDGASTPIDRFDAFKNDISLWYQEMEQAGLTKAEIGLLEKYLLHNFGCSVEQEDVMELSMDKDIANFDIVMANKLRKGIAKKKKDIIEAAKQLFFEEGMKCGT